MDAWRIGYGSDTEGPDQARVTAATVTTVERAHQNLMARIPRYQATVRHAVTGPVWAKLNVNQQAALTSLVYNYGHLPSSVRIFLDAPARTAAAIGALRGANHGLNRRRRLREAKFYLKPVETARHVPVIAGAGASGTVGVALQMATDYHGWALAAICIAVPLGLLAMAMMRKRPQDDPEPAVKRLAGLVEERAALDRDIARTARELRARASEIAAALGAAGGTQGVTPQ